MIFRSCDSRNLNLEPLCTLEKGPLPKLWLTEVKSYQSNCFHAHHAQVESTYRRKGKSESIPDYIANITSPKRARHFDSLVKMDPEVSVTKKGEEHSSILIPPQNGDATTYKYDAWEEDIATLNIFFGQESVMGKSR